MIQRIVTGALLIPVVVVLVYWGPSWLVAMIAAAVALAAIREFFKLGSRMGLRAFRAWTGLCTVALFVVQWLAGGVEVHPLSANTLLIHGQPWRGATVESVFLVFVFGAASFAVLGKTPLAEVLPAIATSSAGLLFVVWPFSFIARMDARAVIGPVLVLFALAIVWAGDTLAYFVGKGIGRTKMAPALSPGKTWEGAIGNVIGSLLVGYGFARWQGGDPTAWLVTAALANVAGQVGDLVESAYKRGAGVKDSGALLPGHGGMLDRIDSLIFAAPVVWLAMGWLLQNRL